MIPVRLSGLAIYDTAHSKLFHGRPALAITSRSHTLHRTFAHSTCELPSCVRGCRGSRFEIESRLGAQLRNSSAKVNFPASAKFWLGEYVPPPVNSYAAPRQMVWVVCDFFLAWHARIVYAYERVGFCRHCIASNFMSGCFLYDIVLIPRTTKSILFTRALYGIATALSKSDEAACLLRR